MEPLGIALGVSGLAPLFRVCTQLFDFVDSSRTRGTDFEVLSTMLEIEQVRLCTWGQAVGFVTDDQSALDTNFPTELDDRLEDRRISAAVSDVLVCMKRIFEDSHSLKKQYGLQKAGDATNSPESRRENGRAAFRTTFKRTLERLNSASASNQRNTTLKASAKWVIVDKKRFETLVEDLRGFNDSLSALLPDIDSFARQEIVADIGESVDADELRLIEQAAVMGSHDDFSEAASVRLSQISQAPHRDDGNESVSTASTPPQPLDVEKLVKQIGKLEAQLRARSKGMLCVSIHKTYEKYWGFVTWDEVDGAGWYMGIEKELEFVKPSYLAWGLQYATENTKIKEAGSSGFEGLDPEAGRNYHGKFPGTKTVEGYASEFQHWAYQHIPRDPKTCLVSTHPAPSLSVKELVERINIIQDSRKLPWGWTDGRKFEDLQKWIGETNDVRADQSYKYSMANQVSMLCSMLNRRDMFEDLWVGSSISYRLFGSKSHGLANFLLQMILAYELKLRLENCKDCSFESTPKVTTALEMAQRWMESVKSVCPNEGKDLVKFRSLVHGRQVEGLIRFAEAIEWPKLPEMREFAEEAYVKIHAGSKVPLIFWDWLYGLVLPGERFVYNLMGALISATPSLRSMGEAKYITASVVIDGKSYWREKLAVGRVFGGMRGVKAVGGWIGPCPAPIEDSVTGWVRVPARAVEFRIPRKPNREGFDDDDNGVPGATPTPSGGTPMQSRLTAEWITKMSDPAMWRIVEAPKPSSERCEFLGLHLKLVESTVSPASPQDQEYRASLDFNVEGESVTFTLYSNPTFVAAHHCLDGPHSVHSNDLVRFKNVCTILDLKNQGHSSNGVLIINATCDGGELAARAWCSRNGQHAVVRRGSGTCFACAVKMASDQGLGVNCLIWA